MPLKKHFLVGLTPNATSRLRFGSPSWVGQWGQMPWADSPGCLLLSSCLQIPKPLSVLCSVMLVLGCGKFVSPFLTTRSRRRRLEGKRKKRTCSCLFAGCLASDDLALSPQLCSSSGFQFLASVHHPSMYLTAPLKRTSSTQVLPLLEANSQHAGLTSPSSLATSSHRPATAPQRTGSYLGPSQMKVSNISPLKSSLSGALVQAPGLIVPRFSLLVPTLERSATMLHLGYLLSSSACLTNSLCSTLSLTITRAVSDFPN